MRNEEITPHNHYNDAHKIDVGHDVGLIQGKKDGPEDLEKGKKQKSQSQPDKNRDGSEITFPEKEEDDIFGEKQKENQKNPDACTNLQGLPEIDDELLLVSKTAHFWQKDSCQG